MTAQKPSCRPPSALRRCPGYQDAPAGLQAKSSLLIGQVFTNQHIMESLAYKEELRAQRPGHVGLFPASPPVPYNDHRAPLQAPWSRTRCSLCQSSVWSAFGLRGAWNRVSEATDGASGISWETVP